MRIAVIALLGMTLTCEAQTKTQRVENIETFFNESAGHITLGGARNGNGFYAGGVTITNWTDLVQLLGLYTNGGFAINVIGGQTNTVGNGSSITITASGSGGGSGTNSAYAKTNSTTQITVHTGTTNLTVIGMNITITPVSVPVVRLSFTCNYSLGMSALNSGKFSIFGSNTTFGSFQVGGTDIQSDDGVSANGGQHQFTFTTILNSGDKIIMGANTFYVTCSVNSGGDSIVINPEGTIATPTCLAVEELGGVGGGGSGTNYYSAGNGLLLATPVFSVDPAIVVTNGGFTINVVGGPTQKVQNASSITIIPSGVNSLGYTNAALSNSSVVGTTAYLGTNIPPIKASNVTANGSVNTNGWSFGTAASGITSLGYTNTVLSNSSVVGGTAYLGTNIPPILPSVTTLNGGFVNTNGWGLDRLNGFIISNSPALAAGVVTSNRNTITIGTGQSGMTNPMTTAGDLIVGGTSGTPTRLPIGQDGNILKVSGGAIGWGQKPSPNTVYDAVIESLGDSTTNNSLVNFSGLTVTTTLPSSNYLLGFSVNFANTTANVTVKFAMLMDGATLAVWQVQGPAATGLTATTIHQEVFASLVSAGLHTIKLQWSTSAGTVTAGSSLTGTNTPCVMTVIQTL